MVSTKPSCIYQPSAETQNRRKVSIRNTTRNHSLVVSRRLIHCVTYFKGLRESRNDRRKNTQEHNYWYEEDRWSGGDAQSNYSCLLLLKKEKPRRGKEIVEKGEAQEEGRKRKQPCLQNKSKFLGRCSEVCCSLAWMSWTHRPSATNLKSIIGPTQQKPQIWRVNPWQLW